MSRSEYERAWGTAGWLDDHEFMGDGRTVRCQRKTKAYEIAERAVKGDAVIKAVYRKEFPDGGELCAAFLWNNFGPNHPQVSTLMHLHLLVQKFDQQTERGASYVTTYLYDIPSGYWRAIVVFKRRAAK